MEIMYSSESPGKVRYEPLVIAVYQGPRFAMAGIQYRSTVISLYNRCPTLTKPLNPQSGTHSVAAKPKKSTSTKRLMQEFEKNGNQSQKKKKAKVVESLDRGGKTNVTTLVDQGIWQAEGGGWHPGYLEVFENQMRASFPQASIEGNYIVGKMKTWKRDYWYLASMLHRPGFGWNANENKFVAEDEVWIYFV